MAITQTIRIENVSTFTVNGQTYEVLRFPEGKGPTLAQSIEIAKGRGEMLTIQEAREIRDNSKSNAAFKNALKPGEWTYVRDQKSEERSRAAYLDRYRYYRRLDVYDYDWPDDAARVVVLKKAGSEAASASAPQVAKSLRVERDETLVMKHLPDGATEVTAVKRQ